MSKFKPQLSKEELKEIIQQQIVDHLDVVGETLEEGALERMIDRLTGGLSYTQGAGGEAVNKIKKTFSDLSQAGREKRGTKFQASAMKALHVKVQKTMMGYKKDMDHLEKISGMKVPEFDEIMKHFEQISAITQKLVGVAAKEKTHTPEQAAALNYLEKSRGGQAPFKSKVGQKPKAAAAPKAAGPTGLQKKWSDALSQSRGAVAAEE